MNSPVRSLLKPILNNAVPLIFIAISAVAIPLSGFSASYLIQELLIRIGRNSFLILSLLIPIMAGMGLNCLQIQHDIWLNAAFGQQAQGFAAF